MIYHIMSSLVFIFCRALAGLVMRWGTGCCTSSSCYQQEWGMKSSTSPVCLAYTGAWTHSCADAWSTCGLWVTARERMFVFECNCQITSVCTNISLMSQSDVCLLHNATSLLFSFLSTFQPPFILSPLQWPVYDTTMFIYPQARRPLGPVLDWGQEGPWHGEGPHIWGHISERRLPGALP